MSTSPASPGLSPTFRKAVEAARPFFQPLVSLRARGVVGYEALARGPEGSAWESAAALLGEAQTQNLLSLLEHRIWSAALQAWQARFPQLMLCLNASVGKSGSLRSADPGYLRVLCGEPNGGGFASGRLVLELSERLTLRQWKKVQPQIHRLRTAGVRLWLDDLGSGASGLQFLPLLRPDGVKLDRLLVGGVDADPYRQAVVRALAKTARQLGLTLVAEGVETESELRCLAALGVDLVQGFLLGRPSPTPDPLGPEVAALLSSLASGPASEPDAPGPRVRRLRSRRPTAWAALRRLSRALRRARSPEEGLSLVGRALTDELACDGLLLWHEPPREPPSEVPPRPGLPGNVRVVLLDGALWPRVPEVQPAAAACSPPPSTPLWERLRFHSHLVSGDPVWGPLYTLATRLGFTCLLTVPVPDAGPRGLTWVAGWRRPVRLAPQALLAATVLADYTAMAWRRRAQPEATSGEGAGREGKPDGGAERE